MQLTLQTTEEFERLVQPGFRVSVVATPEEMHEALAVRRAVFIEEQLIDEDEEIDHYDGDPSTVTDAVHVLGRLDGRPVATARLLIDRPDGEYPHIGRVAVLQSERGRYWGVGVMEALHEEARRRAHAGVTLGAQEYAVGFYAKLGYVARGEVFLDAGIEHRWMDLVFEDAEGGTT